MSVHVFQSARHLVLTLGTLALLVASSHYVAGGVEARVSGPRSDGEAQICGHIQDEFDAYWDAYAQAPVGSPEEAEALNWMHTLEQLWYQWDCDDRYGSITVRPAPIKKVKVTVVVAGNAAR